MENHSPSNLEVPHPNLYRFTSALFDFPFRLNDDVGIHGQQNLPQAGKSYLLAASHRSFLDIPALGRSLLQTRDTSIHFLAKKELWSRKLLMGAFGGYIALNGGFAIDRDKSLPKQRAVIEHVDYLVSKHGIIGTFPEGTRKKEDFEKIDEKSLKISVGLIAAKFGLDIVPVGIAGTHKSERWPVKIAFGQPIPVEKHDFDLFDLRQSNAVKRQFVKPELMPKLWQGMQEALDQAYLHYSPNEPKK